MTESLRERVARSLRNADSYAPTRAEWPEYLPAADAAIAIVLGEAARVAERYQSGCDEHDATESEIASAAHSIAQDILALKEDKP